jgi:hypothetical protein
MLSKCANPFCPNEFLYFGEGKVFVIPREGSTSSAHGSHGKRRTRTEHYWLCSNCASKYTIAVDSTYKIMVVPRRDEDAERATA